MNSRILLTPIAAGTTCPSGGTQIDVGIDANDNGELDQNEIQQTATLCSGPPGVSSPQLDAAVGSRDGGVGTPEVDDGTDGAAPGICGNGVRERGEQCDDGNQMNLDGCDAACRFEQIQRINSLTMQWATDSLCAVNALGSAILAPAQPSFQTSLDAAVSDGTITALLDFRQLDDLTGTGDESIEVGAFSGTPRAGTGYDGKSDLDWWYTTDGASIDSNRIPRAALGGSIVAKVLAAGPGALSVPFNPGGSPGALVMSNALLEATIGAASTPLSSSGSPPGHLPGEHLDPSLTSFGSTQGGELCGNVSATSLSRIALPAALTGGACSVGYLSANSLLDLLVDGCTTLGLVSLVRATQPDQVDPAAPIAGAGGRYQLVTNSQHQVITCKDHAGSAVPLGACLDAAAYSSFFRFSTDRVVVK